MLLDQREALTPAHVRAELAAPDVHAQLRGRALEDHAVNHAFYDVVVARALGVVEHGDVFGANVGQHRVARLERDVPLAAEREAAGRHQDACLVTRPLDTRHLSGQAVVRADELGHEGGLRFQIDVGLCADLFDAARVHHDDAVGDGEGFGLIVRDVDRRLVGLALEVEDRILERVAQVAVERGERFVEEQDARVGGQDARQGHALLLAPGELRRQTLAVAAQLDERQHLVNPLLNDILLLAFHRQPEGEVVGDGEMWKQRRRLKDEADVARVRREIGDVLIVEIDSPGARLDQPGEHPQGGGLAAAGRAEQGDELTLGHVEVEVVDRDGLAKMFSDGGESDASHSSRYTDSTKRTDFADSKNLCHPSNPCNPCTLSFQIRYVPFK